MGKYIGCILLVVLVSCSTSSAGIYENQIDVFQQNYPDSLVDRVIVSLHEDQSNIHIDFFQRQDLYTRHTYTATTFNNDQHVQTSLGSNPLVPINAIPAQQTISFEQALEAALIYIDYPYRSVMGTLYNRDLSQTITEQSDYIWNISYLPDEKGSAGQVDHVLIDALTGEVISVRDRLGNEVEY